MAFKSTSVILLAHSLPLALVYFNLEAPRFLYIGQAFRYSRERFLYI